MQATCSHCGAKYTLNPKDTAAQARVKFRCPKCGETTVMEVGAETLRAKSGATPASAPPAAPAPPAPRPAAKFEATMVNEFSGLALPKDKTITISGIGGPAKGLKHVLTKPRVVVGRLGGGADLEINDGEISRRHCKVEVKQDIVKLHDLNSTNGTFVNDERVPEAELEHLSEFRVGSSLLLVTILHKED